MFTVILVTIANTFHSLSLFLLSFGCSVSNMNMKHDTDQQSLHNFSGRKKFVSKVNFTKRFCHTIAASKKWGTIGKLWWPKLGEWHFWWKSAVKFRLYSWGEHQQMCDISREQSHIHDIRHSDIFNHSANSPSLTQQITGLLNKGGLLRNTNLLSQIIIKPKRASDL